MLLPLLSLFCAIVGCRRRYLWRRDHARTTITTTTTTTTTIAADPLSPAAVPDTLQYTPARQGRASGDSAYHRLDHSAACSVTASRARDLYIRRDFLMPQVLTSEAIDRSCASLAESDRSADALARRTRNSSDFFARDSFSARALFSRSCVDASCDLPRGQNEERRPTGSAASCG